MFIVIHSYKFFIHIIQLRFYDSLTYKVGIGSDKSSPLREVTSWWLWYIKKQLLKASLCLSATLNPQLAHKKAICSTQMAFSRYDLELRLFRQFQFFSTRIDVNLPRLTMIFFFGQKCYIKIFYCIFLNTIVIYSNTLLSRYSALDIGKQCNSNFCPQRAQTVQYNDVHKLHSFSVFQIASIPVSFFKVNTFLLLFEKFTPEQGLPLVTCSIVEEAM